MNYKEQYKHPKWQKKRLEILERDNFTCQSCKRTEQTLHVHHKYYLKNTNIWDYKDNTLITYCNECHQYIEEEKKEIELALRISLFDSGLDEIDILALAVYFINNPKLAKYLAKKGDLICEIRKSMVDYYNQDHAK